MLLILSLGLFPLGLVAILASVQSARDNNDKRAEQTLSQLEIEAQRLTALLSHSSGTIRAASTAIALTAVDSRICETTLRSEEHTSELQSLMRISYAVFCLKKNKT